MVSVTLSAAEISNSRQEGWEVWHLEQAPSSDLCKGRVTQRGEPDLSLLGGHRNYQEL